MDYTNKVMIITGGAHGIGETICVDGYMTKQMIYSGEHGWQYNPKG